MTAFDIARGSPSFCRDGGPREFYEKFWQFQLSPVIIVDIKLVFLFFVVVL